MSRPYSIIILGANGSGKSTLGQALACALNYAHFDVEEYHFRQAVIPYNDMRSASDSCVPRYN
jgi:adenylate kinase family enzyme